MYIVTTTSRGQSMEGEGGVGGHRKYPCLQIIPYSMTLLILNCVSNAIPITNTPLVILMVVVPNLYYITFESNVKVKYT